MSQEKQIRLKYSIIALLYQLSQVDGQVAESELAYILKVAEHIGVDKDEISSIFLNYDSFEITPPKNEQDRMTIFYYLLFFMKSDKNISDQEIKLVKEFAFKLGFRSTMTDELINLVSEKMDDNISPEALLETIRKYNN